MNKMHYARGLRVLEKAYTYETLNSHAEEIGYESKWHSHKQHQRRRPDKHRSKSIPPQPWCLYCTKARGLRDPYTSDSANKYQM